MLGVTTPHLGWEGLKSLQLEVKSSSEADLGQRSPLGQPASVVETVLLNAPASTRALKQDRLVVLVANIPTEL